MIRILGERSFRSHVDPATPPEVAIPFDNLHFGKLCAQCIGSSIGRSIIDNDDSCP